MKPRIKLALGSYDRHGPLPEGAIDHPLFFWSSWKLTHARGAMSVFYKTLSSTLKKREQNP
jgi:hypothetical protein